MTGRIIRRSVETGLEERIVTGLIVSDRFITNIYPCYEATYFTSQLARDVSRWAIDYFEHYEKAPQLHIQDIFDSKRNSLDEDHSLLIEKFLTKLSREYEKIPHINEDYYIDQALGYFKKRELKLVSESVGRLADSENVDEAESVLLGYKKVAKITSGWYDPFDSDVILDTFENKNESLFQFPGQLGNFLGPLERGWLVSVVGGFKRGKTWYLQEIAVQALLSNLRVAFISLEMKKSSLNTRLYKRLIGAGDEEETNFIYPVFDCKASQDGSCVKPNRASRRPLIGEDGAIPVYSHELLYQPCSICRGRNEDYIPAVWFETLKRPQFKLSTVREMSSDFVKYVGGNLRIKTYPRFSATVSDIKRDLDILEDTEGFIPDVIIVDYAGIIRPERRGGQDYTQLDDIWKSLGGLAGERHALVATGSQVTRGALKANSAEQDSVAGWVGQVAHVDLMFGLNQKPEEKRNGIMRINLLAHRHKEFYENESCVLLQQLKTGQPFLDSLVVEEEIQ